MYNSSSPLLKVGAWALIVNQFFFVWIRVIRG